MSIASSLRYCPIPLPCMLSSRRGLLLDFPIVLSFVFRLCLWRALDSTNFFPLSRGSPRSPSSSTVTLSQDFDTPPGVPAYSSSCPPPLTVPSAFLPAAIYRVSDLRLRLPISRLLLLSLDLGDSLCSLGRSWSSDLHACAAHQSQLIGCRSVPLAQWKSEPVLLWRILPDFSL